MHLRTLSLPLLITTGIVLTIVADVLLKKSHFSDWRYVALGCLLYGSSALLVAAAFRFTDFGMLFMVWEAITVVFGLAVGTVLFREPFTLLKFVAFLLVLGALGLSYIASQ